MKKLSRNIISLAAAGTLGCGAFVSCLQEELAPEDIGTPYEFEYIGNPTDALLEIAVEGLSASVMTRGDGVVDDSEAERRVTDIWVFQYNGDGAKLISDPQYLTVASDNQELLRNIPITLSDNGGSPCIVYVVTNTGDSSWGKPDADFTGFQTIDELKRQTIPDPSAIRIDGTADEAALAIPMGGGRGEDDELVIEKGMVVRVPVRRMFAKLVMNLLVKDGQGLTSTLTNFTVDKIVNSCTVATTYNEDGSWYYPSLASFDVSRNFVPDNSTTDSSVSGQITYGEFVIYVPENIQKDADNAVKVSPQLNVVLDGGTVLAPNPAFTAYPGSWSDRVSSDSSTIDPEWDYTIQRNCVYYISFTIDMEDVVVPSANSFIASAGTTIAFYPYVRDEELNSEMQDGGTLADRYTFSTYLDPTDESGEKTISKVAIVWQTEDCIGDNSKFDLVTIDEVGTDVVDERHRKIYVKVANPGNALIAAYNSAGDIVWSWHIWVPNEGVDPEGQAIEYYHYQWDENGIYTDTFVPGRLVMRLNLGALSNAPANQGELDFDTYGMLYQWGRKDPFLPMRVTPKDAGQKGGSVAFYNYGDINDVGPTNRKYDVYIGAHDNGNVAVPMSDNDGTIAGKEKYLFDTNAPTGTLGGDFGSDDDQVIRSTVQHPTTFVSAAVTMTSVSQSIDDYYNEGDWLPVEDDLLWGGLDPANCKKLHVYGSGDALASSGTIEAYLSDNYGPEKTIFDPCPYGWRVSPGDIWLGFTKDGLNWVHNSDGENETGTASEHWDEINVLKGETPEMVAKQCGYTMYMQGWGTGATSFFPTQGSRVSSGQPYLLGGECGNYHNATADMDQSLTSWNGKSARRVDIIHFHDANDSRTEINGEKAIIRQFTTELYYYVKTVAGPLRCVRDTK